MKKFVAFTLCSLTGLGLVGADLRAQATKSPQLVSLFREVIARSSQSTVRVLADGKEAALGIVVSADGWILSKYSELKDKKLICRLPDGTEAAARIVGFDVPFDLAMLKVDAKNLTPVEWTDSKAAHLGHWVASAGPGKDPVAVGVVSVLSREVKASKFLSFSGTPGGYLGLALDLEFAGVKIEEVLPDTPAKKAGLKNEDQVLTVNGETVRNADEFKALVARKKPGEEVTLKITREGKQLDFKIKLAESPSKKGEMQNKMGSKLSDRRAGFPIVLQHDSVVRPNDCGGPLVNLDGKVVGINISRAGRTETYAIPSEVVRPMLERLKMTR